MCSGGKMCAVEREEAERIKGRKTNKVEKKEEEKKKNTRVLFI